MTLILTCVTRHHIVQVSDRRLTLPDGTLIDDEANKAIVAEGCASLCYTGIARVGQKATDIWITQVLADRDPRTAFFEHLRQEAAKAIESLQQAEKRLAIVVGFYGRYGDLPEGSPCVSLISNWHGEKLAVQAKALPSFSEWSTHLPNDREFVVIPTGQTIDRQIYRRLIRNLRGLYYAARRRDSLPSPKSIATFLAMCIRSMAKGNNRIGESLLQVILPNRRILGQETALPESAYLPAGKTDLISVMPNYVYAGTAVAGVRLWSSVKYSGTSYTPPQL